MGWDKGRYYTRSKKVKGRVVREYVVSGRAAAGAAGNLGKVRKDRGMPAGRPTERPP